MPTASKGLKGSYLVVVVVVVFIGSNSSRDHKNPFQNKIVDIYSFVDNTCGPMGNL